MGTIKNNVTKEIYTFDPTDENTVLFLSRLGLTPEDMRDGVLSPRENSRLGLSFYSDMLKSDSEGSETTYRLDENHVAMWNQLFSQFSTQAFSALFHDSGNPDCEITKWSTASAVSSAVPRRVYSIQENLPGLSCEEEYFRENGFSTRQLVESYFNDTTVTPAWADIGKSVVKLEIASSTMPSKGNGSGVLLSADGSVGTAYHVLYDREGSGDRRDAVLIYEGRRIPITPDDIIYENRDWDVVILKIPALAEIGDLPYAKIAVSPPGRGEQVTSVGYTGYQALGVNNSLSSSGSDQAPKIERLYTFGDLDVPDDSYPAAQMERLQELTFLSTKRFPKPLLASISGTRPGMSGGGLYDVEGRLIGLNSWGEENTNISSYAVLIPELITDPELKAIMTNIICRQQTLSASALTSSNDVTPDSESGKSLPLAGDDTAQEEIIVQEYRSTKESWQRLDNKMDALGYRSHIRSDGTHVYRPEKNYAPSVFVSEGGALYLRRTPPRFLFKSIAEDCPACLLLFPISPMSFVQAGGWFIGDKKLNRQKAEILTAMRDDVENLNDSISSDYISDRLDRIPDELEDFWEGRKTADQLVSIDLHETGIESSPITKRGAILEYWRSRIECDAGLRIRTGLAAFMESTIMTSSFPFTEEEINAANAAREWGSPLILELP